MLLAGREKKKGERETGRGAVLPLMGSRKCAFLPARAHTRPPTEDRKWSFWVFFYIWSVRAVRLTYARACNSRVLILLLVSKLILGSHSNCIGLFDT
jgi:hypothetical protein